MFEKRHWKNLREKGNAVFYWAPARLFHSAGLMQKSELTRKFSDFKTLKRMFSLHQVVWKWSQQMLTGPHNEMLESRLVQIYINIRYPTKYKEALFCKIRFDHPSTRSGFHGDLRERGGGESAMPQLRDEISDAQKPLFHTIKLLSSISFFRWHECNESLIYVWGIKTRTPTHVWVENRHRFNRIGDIYLPDTSVSAWFGVGLQWGGENSWRWRGYVAFHLLWVWLTDAVFLLITPPTELQLQLRLWCRIPVSVNWTEKLDQDTSHPELGKYTDDGVMLVGLKQRGGILLFAERCDGRLLVACWKAWRIWNRFPALQVHKGPLFHQVLQAESWNLTSPRVEGSRGHGRALSQVESTEPFWREGPAPASVLSQGGQGINWVLINDLIGKQVQNYHICCNSSCS